jgi:D-aminopeptidase
MSRRPVESAERRLRDLGIVVGRMAPGPFNAITDVPGVRVGHVTKIAGPSCRTGVTAILPHGGNLHAERVPAGLFVANGHGKAAGLSQLAELGEIETPIVLTNTLAVGRAVEAVIDHVLAQPGNETVRSVNAIVGETNDSPLNDIRRRGIDARDVHAALAAAAGPGGTGPVVEGCVGAGTGTVALGWKAGIGTASRAVSGGHVGVLVQANYGGHLRLAGRDIGPPPGPVQPVGPGSVMVIVATDLPVDDRNLARLAARAMAGIARTGADFSNGSGDYAIAFSTHPGLRRRREGAPEPGVPTLANPAMDAPFRAVAEATEEAALNALTAAVTMRSIDAIGGGEILREALDLGAPRLPG